MQASRRLFLGGLGAALVAAYAAPALRATVPARKIPAFVVPPAERGVTLSYLQKTMASIGQQIEVLGELTQRERKAVAEQIDAAMDEVKPVGVTITVKSTLEDIKSGRLLIVEPFSTPGSIHVVGLSRE